MSVTVEEVDKIWREADCIWTEHQIERAIETVSQQIEADLAHKNPLVLVVMKGGLMFGARLLMRLRFALEMDYIHVTRYGMETSGNELLWKVLPQHPLEGRQPVAQARGGVIKPDCVDASLRWRTGGSPVQKVAILLPLDVLRQ